MSALARAYVNHGRWIADCPRPYCANAEHIDAAQCQFHCSNCHFEAPVERPREAAAIDAVLALRPVPQTRNWFPSGHELALRHSCPHGQTAADLIAENHEHGVS